MRRVLERCMIRREHDVTEQCEFRVNRGRSVDRRNHGCLNFEQVHQQTFRVGQDVLSPRFGIDLTATEIFLVDERFAGARKDDDFVLGIAADVAEAVTKLLMRQKAPN